MAIVDRRRSVSGDTAIKAPCRAATTANIVLAGEQTIDGIACVADDRVLVKGQTLGYENGIYCVSTGNWTRERDFDGAYDIVKGTLARVTNGANAGFWEVTTSNPITIGSTSLAFAITTNALSGVSTFAQSLLGLTTGAAFSSALGNVTFSGTVGIAGNFALNTNKFTIAAASGNTVIAGTLSVSGIVTASFGATITAGGLTVTAGGATITAGGLTVTAGGLTVTAGTVAFPTGAYASDAEMAAASSSTDIVVPSTMKSHPGVPKAVGWCTVSGATVTIQPGGYGISAVSRVLQGVYQVTLTTAMSSTAYGAHITCQTSGLVTAFLVTGSKSTTVFRFECSRTTDGALDDPTGLMITVYGAQ